jgi:hypothetical protein
LRGGSNLFAYAPNPLGWVDPFGLNKKCPDCPEGQSRDVSKKLNDIPKNGKTIASSTTRKGTTKTEMLFADRNDAMNWSRQQLGHDATRTYNANGQWNGWVNSQGDRVYWNHGDWGKGVGKSTYPHLNYQIDGQQGHLFLGDKINNRGMGNSFVEEFSL